jgi:hypothetical protein
MKVATAPIAQFPGATFAKKKALLATVKFRRREFWLTRRHSDTVISMNSRYDPCAGRNLPPAIGRLICCGRSLPQKCGATFRTSLLCEALGMSWFHVHAAQYQMETTN